MSRLSATSFRSNSNLILRRSVGNNEMIQQPLDEEQMNSKKRMILKKQQQKNKEAIEFLEDIRPKRQATAKYDIFDEENPYK